MARYVLFRTGAPSSGEWGYTVTECNDGSTRSASQGLNGEWALELTGITGIAASILCSLRTLFGIKARTLGKAPQVAFGQPEVMLILVGIQVWICVHAR